MTGFSVGGGFHCGHDGVDYAKGDGFILLDRLVLDAVCFKLTGETPSQSSV